MSTKRNYFYFAALICFSGFFGLAQAYDAQSVAVAKTDSKAATASKAKKIAKSSKTSKTAKSSKAAKIASKTKPVTIANAPVAAQSVNPYLANQPVNPFFASQASNPYLAYRYEKPYQLAQASASSATARAATPSVVPQRPAISKISFAPMPVTIYLNPNQKPTMAVSTPCSAMEKVTGNNPMFKAFEQMAFGMIGNVNEAGFMPMIIEPVCT